MSHQTNKARAILVSRVLTEAVISAFGKSTHEKAPSNFEGSRMVHDTLTTPRTTHGRTRWMWVFGGAAYGLLMRVLFGFVPSGAGGVMSVAFLIGTPFVVGAITIYGSRHDAPSVGDMFLKPWISIGLMLVGCAITLLEGSICLVMLFPLFLLCSSAGGLVMGMVLRMFAARPSQLSAFALLPLAMLVGESQMELHDSTQEIKQSLVVHAPPPVVWAQIMNARNIQAAELPPTLAHIIGVPQPVEGVNLPTAQGEVRYSQWDHGVHFQAHVSQRKENESITWNYRFSEHSFPKGTMDEHVVIGGKYFDLNDTTFNLSPLNGSKTSLEIVAHYRVTSSINAYAVPLASLLGNDFVKTILILYKNRSEAALQTLTAQGTVEGGLQ